MLVDFMNLSNDNHYTTHGNYRMKSGISEIISAKRTHNERKGIHAWHPYYAGYSEGFVESIIQSYGIEESLVLDPWAGSGTTNLVCERWDINSIGLDINPVMVFFASAKQGVVLSYFESLSIEKKIKQLKLGISDFSQCDSLQEIMSLQLSQQLGEILNFIINTDLPSPSLNQSISEFSEMVDYVNPIRSFLISCLFVTARKLSGYTKGSNPTWFKKINQRPTYDFAAIKDQFLNTTLKMILDLEVLNKTKKSQEYLNCVADSRSIPLPDSSIDYVITSPPYLTRIDYAMSTQLELLLLSDIENLRKIREMTMGAPVILKEQIGIDPNWGTCTLDTLQKIKNHPSKASKSYYLKNFKQYFRDAHESLKSINRVLKKGGKAFLVVQSSYYKEIEIPLGELYIEMGKSIGFDAQIIFRDIVKGHMAHVNTKSSEYKKDKVYFEDVVEFTKM